MTETSRALSPPRRVVVVGGTGRMGVAITTAVKESNGVVLSGITFREGRPAPAVDDGFGQPVPAVTRLEELIDRTDVVIDFTSPDASMQHARLCAEKKVALVLGTTGFSPEQRQELESLAGSTPIVLAPNMSVGVNLLFQLARQVAEVLGEDFDIEITEAHHRNKKDAPSGTALRLAEAVCAGRGLDPTRDLVHGREGDVGARTQNEVGMQVIRGGDVVGDHTVHFLGDGERIELTHRATSRMTFARGAVRAAKWIGDRAPGLYDMLDVLGLTRKQEA